jgi:hypothetical protein
MGRILRGLRESKGDIETYILDPAVDYVIQKTNPYFYAMATLLLLMILVLFYVAFIKQHGGVICEDCHRRLRLRAVGL